MKIIFDLRALRLYPVSKPGFHGGTETYARKMVKHLSLAGHEVHVIAPDLDHDERRGASEWWWTTVAFPTNADVLVEFHNLEGITNSSFDAPILICATNGVDPWVGEFSKFVDGWPVFSKVHRDLLCKTRGIDLEKCYMTGLGVTPSMAHIECHTVNGRLLYANDPARGLWHVLDIYDQLKRIIPDASLHVAYDFDRHFAMYQYQATALAERMWDCYERMRSGDAVNVGDADITKEQLECHVHAMPSDPPNIGSQIHGITQMECAAAGVPLVLSDTEAFPEIFGEAATILPLPGTYLHDHQRRYDAQDWAERIELEMKDPAVWAESSRKSRELAEQNTWFHVGKRWEKMLENIALKQLGEKALVHANS